MAKRINQADKSARISRPIFDAATMVGEFHSLPAPKVKAGDWKETPPLPDWAREDATEVYAKLPANRRPITMDDNFIRRVHQWGWKFDPHSRLAGKLYLYLMHSEPRYASHLKEDWHLMRRAGCSDDDAAALIAGFEKLQRTPDLARIPEPRFRQSMLERADNAKEESGSFNTVVPVRSKLIDDESMWVFKPEPLPGKLDGEVAALCWEYGLALTPDFNGRNLAACVLDRMLGWKIMVECELAQFGGRLGIAMSHGGQLAPTDRTVREIPAAQATPLVNEYNQAQRQGKPAVFAFLAKHKFLSFAKDHHGNVEVVLNARKSNDERQGGHTWGEKARSQWAFEWAILKLLRKGPFDFLVMNLDAHSCNYTIHKEHGLQAFDYDFSFSPIYISPDDLPDDLRFNLDKRIELPLAIEEKTLRDLQNFDVEAYEIAVKPFLNDQEINAFRQRYAYLMEYVRKIEVFPSRELDEPDSARLKAFMQSPSTNYIGRDLTYKISD